MNVFYCNFLTRYGRSNITDKLEKQCFFFRLSAITESCQNFCDCSKKLNLQSYMIRHATNLLIHVLIKNGRPNMADKWQNDVVFFNLELSAIGRSCQNSITEDSTEVGNNICGAT